MLKKTGGVIVILLAVLVGAVVFLNSWKQPTLNGPWVTINSGGHHIEGVLTKYSTFQFLLKDKGVSVGTFSGDAFVTMLPFNMAEQLRAKYGDFFKCNEPGAVQAIQNLQSAILVAATGKTRKDVAKAMALVRQSRIPVVSFTGARLQVAKHTYIGMEVDDESGIPIYFFTDFKIVKPDYLK
ncbi:MAG: hypothetical protein V2A78_10605 [bacterium]